MFEREIFAERLRQRRLEKGLGLREVSRYLGITSSTMVEYEKHIAFPGPEKLTALASLLDCSIDYLLGLTSNPQRLPEDPKQ